MRTTATLIATLMLGVASCAYAQGGPAEGGAGGPVGIGGGAPGGGPADGGGPGGGPDVRGPPSAQGRGPAAEGAGRGDGPSAERGAPRGEASEGPSSGERGARQKSAEESPRGQGPKGETSKASRSERRADDGDARGSGDKQLKKSDDDGDKSRQHSADKAESKDLAKDAGRQKKDELTDKPATAPKDADTARAEKPDRAKQVDLSGDKRDRVQSAFRDKGDVKHRTKVDIDISVGRRLPRDWGFAPVPIAVIEVVPEYRDYVFVWVEDEYVICDPVTYEVVAVIPAGGRHHASASSAGGECSARLTLSEDQEEFILKSVRLGHEVDVADLEVGWSVPSDIELETFPAAVLSEADELSACRYFIADDQLAIVDPDEDKVVLLIDKS